MGDYSKEVTKRYCGIKRIGFVYVLFCFPFSCLSACIGLEATFECGWLWSSRERKSDDVGGIVGNCSNEIS